MSESPRSFARPWRRALVAFAAGVALSAGAGFWLGPLGRRSPQPAPLPIQPSGQLELARSALPRSGLIPISFALGEPCADANPLPVLLFSMSDRREIKVEGRLDSVRTTTTIEVDPSWLLPGAYLVQIQTTARSPLPLRRYVIVVH